MSQPERIHVSRPISLLLCLSITAVGSLTAACGDVSISVPPEREGDDPGECYDSADNDGNGLFDCDDPACSGAEECQDNLAPGAPLVRIDPETPDTTDTIRCIIETASVDPEGHLVEYAYSWTVDGNDAAVDATAVDPGQTNRGEHWMCTVVPEDEFGAVGPGSSAAVDVNNARPTAPEISIVPGAPQVTDELYCEITTESTDADGDPISYSVEWVRNGSETGITQDYVPAQSTETNDLWVCKVVPFDGFEIGSSAEDSVNVHVDVSPHVVAGQDHSCSVQLDGSYACWGANGSGQLDGPDESFWKLEAGPDFSCGIRFSDTSVRCWGDDSENQLLTPLGSYVDLAVGNSHACAVRSNAELIFWGSAYDWGDSPPGGIAVQVTAGDDYCCALMEDGAIACWGEAPAADPGSTWTEFDGGADHFCAIGDDGVTCWGDDSYGQVSSAPTTGTFSQVSAGRRHTCAIEEGSQFVTCWGDDSHGQATPPSGTFSQVGAGWYHTCGKRPNDTVECWGCVGEDSGQCSPTF
jgi:hypothetical protein